MIAATGANLWNDELLSNIPALLLSPSFFVEMSLLLAVYSLKKSPSLWLWALVVVGFFMSIFTINQENVKNYLNNVDEKSALIIKQIDSEIQSREAQRQAFLRIERKTAAAKQLDKISELNIKRAELILSSGTSDASLVDLLFSTGFIIFIQLVNVSGLYVLLSKGKTLNNIKQETATDLEEKMRVYITKKAHEKSQRKVAQYFETSLASVNRFINDGISLKADVQERIKNEMQKELSL
jgi:threonyl-tRNA synthetase